MTIIQTYDSSSNGPAIGSLVIYDNKEYVVIDSKIVTFNPYYSEYELTLGYR